MASDSPKPFSGGDDTEEEIGSKHRDLPDQVLQNMLKRELDRDFLSRLPDGGKMYLQSQTAARREISRRQAACSGPPPPSSECHHGRQGELDANRCERMVQSSCAESFDLQASSSLPTQMETTACPAVQLPDERIPKLEPCEDSPVPASDTAEGWETSPLSCNHPFFTTVMAKTHVEKPFQLSIPARFIRHLPEARTAAVLLCREKSWPVTYCGDLKMKKLDTPSWMEFAVDNRLQVGDACVFELVTGAGGHEDEVVFRVQILRGGLPKEVTSQGATSDEPIVIME